MASSLKRHREMVTSGSVGSGRYRLDPHRYINKLDINRRVLPGTVSLEIHEPIVYPSETHNVAHTTSGNLNIPSLLYQRLDHGPARFLAFAAAQSEDCESARATCASVHKPRITDVYCISRHMWPYLGGVKPILAVLPSAPYSTFTPSSDQSREDVAAPNRPRQSNGSSPSSPRRAPLVPYSTTYPLYRRHVYTTPLQETHSSKLSDGFHGDTAAEPPAPGLLGLSSVARRALPRLLRRHGPLGSSAPSEPVGGRRSVEWRGDLRG